MMRRLLVLMLVLGIASAASAATVAVYTNTTQGVDALTNDAAIGDTIVITVGLDAASAGGSAGFSIDVDHSTGGVAAVLGVWTMPPVASVAPFPPTGESFILGNGIIGLPANPGDYFSATFQVPASALGLDIDVAYNGSIAGGTPAGAKLPVIPEPITIALLGLGGLFLRRRK